MSSRPIDLVLADDHPIVLRGLENLFQLTDGFRVVACCADGHEALAAVRRHRPQVAILDIKMPGLDGLAVVEALLDEKLGTRVVLLTATLDESLVLRAMSLGVHGLVLKETAPKVLVRAVREVSDGGQWFEHRVLGSALKRMLQRTQGEREAAADLTATEIKIVRMVASGLRNRQIADTLCVSEGTVKTHLHNIYGKLGVSGRLELTLHAQKKGLV